MNAIIRDILSAPAEERLDYALDLLRTLTCDSHEDVAHYQAMGLSPQQAKIVNYLVRRAGMVCTRDQLMMVLYDAESDVSDKIVDVHLSKIRPKLPKGIIETVYGAGFRVSPEAAAKIAPPPATTQKITRTGEQPVVDRVRASLPGAGKPWTPDDDEELERMRAQGSPWWVIADEMSRTERACQDRHRLIRMRQTA